VCIESAYLSSHVFNYNISKYISMALKYHLIAVIILFCSSCGDSSSIDRLRDLVKNNSPELTTICNHFLVDNTVRNISIAKSFDINKCEALNSWSYCGGKWETWDSKKDKEIYLYFKKDVLKHENINICSYNKFVNFLQKNKIESISKVYNCNRCIDFETALDGLRYSVDSKYILKEDDEYLWVKRINGNWHFYHRDWN
jgi:hypothetical protein